MAAPGDHISVLCGCGKKLKAPATAVGRKAKCPSCGNVLTIEAPPPPPQEQEDDPFGALYDLAEAEKKAAATNQIDESSRCPKCGASMGSGAVLCVSCGYDLRSKSKVTAKPVQAGKPILDLESAKSSTKKSKDKMAPQGSFMLGLAVSVGLGALGGLVWFLVTWFTDYDLAFLCILVGILAGVGMQIGQKGFSKAGGWAAMGVTFLVMILARLAVVIAVLIPMLRHSASTLGASDASADDDSEDREQVEEHYADQELKQMGANLDHPTEAQEKAAVVVAEAKVKKMTPAQIKAEVAKEDAEDEAADKAAETANAKSHNSSSDSASTPSDASTSSGSSGHGAAAALGAVVILLIFFGWKSTIFMIFALGAAYKAASGTSS